MLHDVLAQVLMLLNQMLADSQIVVISVTVAYVALAALKVVRREIGLSGGTSFASRGRGYSYQDDARDRFAAGLAPNQAWGESARYQRAMTEPGPGAWNRSQIKRQRDLAHDRRVRREHAARARRRR